jgi:predicted transcriptional regulator
VGETLPTPKDVVVSGKTALTVAEALNSTTLLMLQILTTERLDITTMAKRIGLSEAYISEQVRALEELNLINITYERGKRGIRKICDSTVEKITLIIHEQPK